MNRPKIGLLPLYLELYGRVCADMRSEMEAFVSTIVSQFEKRNMDVVKGTICCVKKEFAEAVALFENADVDVIVTLHLAYSPSLESERALAETELPIVVLDTTPDYVFGPGQDPEKIMFNHGIHGVQDMCNLLMRNKKQFFIEAGHWKESDVIERTVKCIQALRMAANMRSCRVGIIGQRFKGMGDFAVPFETLQKTLGIKTIECKSDDLRTLLPKEHDPDIDVEIEKDCVRFLCNNINPEVHERSVFASLAVRRWIEKENLSAFTFNFLDINSSSGLPTVPFLEASKAMARGLGYAGEGDVLTAALVGTLLSCFSETSFIEIFCPDWKGNRLFLSHMGEMNLKLTDTKPELTEKPFSYTDAENPAVAVGKFKPGKATLVNLAPLSNKTYALIIAPIEVCKTNNEKDKMTNSIRGWIQPRMNITDFLSAYSSNGGTHHSAMVYGDMRDIISKFGGIMGWKVVNID